ncbi:MarR family winged helix-turn-helix transcriptional regulator [Nocardia sp. NPDC057227]|uniref:MarR family winged helix-turn-helix transcriptional regulator n=1 Tax=Nocardia sp. NPDC057227 TaxID=3346056 RepID=UPI003644A37A
MDDAVDLIEFEAMLFGRYSLASRGAEPAGLDRRIYTLLSRIAAQAPMSIGQLSEALGLDTSTINRQTAAAVRAGQLRRIPDPDGALARKFEITDDGREFLERERVTRVGYLEDILADWPDRDRTALADCLQRFNSAIERRHGAEWPRPGRSALPHSSVPGQL